MQGPCRVSACRTMRLTITYESIELHAQRLLASVAKQKEASHVSSVVSTAVYHDPLLASMGVQKYFGVIAHHVTGIKPCCSPDMHVWLQLSVDLLFFMAMIVS